MLKEHTKVDNKKEFRSHCLKELKKLARRKPYIKDKRAVEKLYRHMRHMNAQNIMLYLPLSMEVNIYPLILKLRKEQKNLYVPFMEGASFRLVRYRLPLFKKQFGIKEPKDSKQFRRKKLDIAIVPIVGMDATHRRVGFGKGMYDRFFEKNKKNIEEVIFVARTLCYSKGIVTDHYDVKADIVIVPK